MLLCMNVGELTSASWRRRGPAAPPPPPTPSPVPGLIMPSRGHGEAVLIGHTALAAAVDGAVGDGGVAQPVPLVVALAHLRSGGSWAGGLVWAKQLCTVAAQGMGAAPDTYAPNWPPAPACTGRPKLPRMLPATRRAASPCTAPWLPAPAAGTARRPTAQRSRGRTCRPGGVASQRAVLPAGLSPAAAGRAISGRAGPRAARPATHEMSPLCRTSE